MEMKGTAVVIGASRGIGLETAKRLSDSHDTLVLTERPDRLSGLWEEAAGLEAEYGIKPVCLELDLRNLASVKETFAQICAQESYVRTLVCNAGVNTLCPSAEVTEEIWDDVVDINLKGNFFAMQYAAASMIQNDGGSIVAIASQHAVRPNLERAPYCASKAGLVQICKQLALEWAPHQIRVNTVSPTYILYEENNDYLMSAKMRRECLSAIPLGRYGTAEDVADAVEFLVSKRAGMITGHNLLVDGGWVL